MHLEVKMVSFVYTISMIHTTEQNHMGIWKLWIEFFLKIIYKFFVFGHVCISSRAFNRHMLSVVETMALNVNPDFGNLNERLSSVVWLPVAYYLCLLW